MLLAIMWGILHDHLVFPYIPGIHTLYDLPPYHLHAGDVPVALQYYHRENNKSLSAPLALLEPLQLLWQGPN